MSTTIERAKVRRSEKDPTWVRFYDIEVAPGIKVEVGTRGYPGRGDRSSKSRIFLCTKGESLIENMANRNSRPVREWGKVVRKTVLPALGLTDTCRWSIHAGCGMCPCSPGFILDAYLLLDEATGTLNHGAKPHYAHNPLQVDLWVTIDYSIFDGTGGVIEGPELDARREMIARSFASDPTLAPYAGVVIS